ncbi:hypothetical protein CCMA1212_006360 [Trichoderma ghanense]|uniref:Uncharacterized protein n=1 Tax=Trichoderma ghanense TaxID=65468 RepID=A0ABY2H0Y8_9HYPO
MVRLGHLLHLGRRRNLDIALLVLAHRLVHVVKVNLVLVQLVLLGIALLFILLRALLLVLRVADEAVEHAVVVVLAVVNGVGAALAPPPRAHSVGEVLPLGVALLAFHVDDVLLVGILLALAEEASAPLHPAAQLHLALENVQLALEGEQAVEALCPLGEHLLQAVEVVQQLGLRGQRTAVGHQRPLHPGHEGAGAAGPSVQAGGDLVEQDAGQGAVDALDCVADGVDVGRVQTGLEQVCVVGLEGLGEDGGEGLVGGRGDGAARCLGGGVAVCRRLLQHGGDVDGLAAAQQLAERGRRLLLGVGLGLVRVVLLGLLLAVGQGLLLSLGLAIHVLNVGHVLVAVRVGRDLYRLGLRAAQSIGAGDGCSGLINCVPGRPPRIRLYDRRGQFGRGSSLGGRHGGWKRREDGGEEVEDVDGGRCKATSSRCEDVAAVLFLLLSLFVRGDEDGKMQEKRLEKRMQNAECRRSSSPLCC